MSNDIKPDNKENNNSPFAALAALKGTLPKEKVEVKVSNKQMPVQKDAPTDLAPRNPRPANKRRWARKPKAKPAPQVAEATDDKPQVERKCIDFSLPKDGIYVRPVMGNEKRSPIPLFTPNTWRDSTLIRMERRRSRTAIYFGRKQASQDGKRPDAAARQALLFGLDFANYGEWRDFVAAVEACFELINEHESDGVRWKGANVGKTFVQQAYRKRQAESGEPLYVPPVLAESSVDKAVIILDAETAGCTEMVTPLDEALIEELRAKARAEAKGEAPGALPDPVVE